RDAQLYDSSPPHVNSLPHYVPLDGVPWACSREPNHAGRGQGTTSLSQNHAMTFGLRKTAVRWQLPPATANVGQGLVPCRTMLAAGVTPIAPKARRSHSLLVHRPRIKAGIARAAAL